MDNQQRRLNENEYGIFIALATVIRNDDSERLSEILRNAAELDPQSKDRILNVGLDGVLILNTAVLHGNLAACQILVAHGANIENHDSNGHRAIDLLNIEDYPIPNKQGLRNWFEAKHRERGEGRPRQEVQPRGARRDPLGGKEREHD